MSAKPAVHRMAHFYLSNTMPGFAGDAYKPLAAIIVHVHSDHLVNLCVFDANGVTHPMTSVPFVLDGEEVPAGNYARFSEYQVGQAQRTEQAEAQLAAATGAQTGIDPPTYDPDAPSEDPAPQGGGGHGEE